MAEMSTQGAIDAQGSCCAHTLPLLQVSLRCVGLSGACPAAGGGKHTAGLHEPSRPRKHSSRSGEIQS